MTRFVWPAPGSNPERSEFVHHCTLVGFEALCAKLGLRIIERLVLTGGNAVTFLPNLLGSLALYRVTS